MFAAFFLSVSLFGIFGKEQQPTSSQTSSHATQSVAVATLFTVSARTPDGIGPSIDGAFVLRHSILATLPSQHFVSTETRFVGLDSFSQYSAHLSDGIKQEWVDVYRFQSPGGIHGDLVDIELRFVALVTPDVPPHFIPMIRGIGYEVWMTHAPINASEIRNEQIRQETLVDGAMGISELTKLDGLRMGREFDTVIMVDCDVMFHKLFTIDNPREKIQAQVVNEDVSPSSVWAPGAGGLLNIEAILGWTKGGWVSERINGGFLVFSPRHPKAALHLQRIVELLREGDFRPGSGWKGRGIGWTYGGRTIQGVLPHYFFLEATEDHNNNNNNNNITTSTTLTFRPHVQLDRCRYNNMVQLEPCKVVPFSTVTSNHFTGDCVKPWTCAHRPHPLCGQFVDAWLDTYRMALLGDPRVRHVVKKSDELSVFAMAKWVKSGGRCPGRGHFVSLAASMLRYAPLH
ncbi:GPI-anchored surface protein, putative [Bodo saltans]|uniref:GPI-anchored surface protein, putative n=1 Tax=Bodo saltans TaxID=75058 RepID=A0A0S4JC22_BODSA|nr:GPI-anchored surface protein, putative [Bodo saltans]|eukprot:CUG87013.1 GPI-anchored surface protein, putative [Bodo saltans]